MLSIHIHDDAIKGAAYHADHLASGSSTTDYYAKGEAAPGRYFGKGAARLHLSGQTQNQAIERLFDNRDPATNQPLTQRRKKNAKAAWDMTFSAPKSISIMSLVFDDKRVVEAHNKALEESLVEVEKRAMARVRINGDNTDRLTGNLVGAQFMHFTSRESDPQLHHHCLVFNATYDEVEQRWKALQTAEIYRRSPLITAVYRSALARELHHLGYATESNGREGIEIKGVSREVIDLFSKRHRQIEEIAAQRDAADNPELRAGIARKFRKTKDTSRSIEDLRAAWLDQLTPEQRTQLGSLKADASAPLALEKVSAEAALELAARHLFERCSVVSPDDLCREALAAVPGQVELAGLEATLASERLKTEDQKFLFQGDEVTTPAAIAAEKEMVAFVDETAGSCQPLNPAFVPASGLDAEQRAAVSMLLRCPDRVASLHGPAGTGKTRTLTELHRGLRAAARNVLMCGPSANAVKILKKDGFQSAQTLQRFLVDKEMQRDLSGGVLVLDEAGLVSVRQMNELFQIAANRNLRVILSGDSRQHTSVESGDALRILEGHSQLARAAISTIWRQTHLGFKAAVSQLKDGKTAEGFKALDSLGWVRQMGSDSRYQEIAAAYLDARTHRKSCLVVCATWREGEEVTRHIRASLQAKGILASEERSTTVLHPFNWTEAHRAQSHRYQPGQVIVFDRKSPLFARGEHLEVTGVHGKFVVVKKENGETHLLQPRKEAKRISLYEPKMISIAAGDQLLIRRNGTSGSGSKLLNGELVEVREIAPTGLITLRDGRTIPSTFRHLLHGYAVSSQSSQGKTVDRVLVAIDAMSASSAATRATLYVAASRGRESCTLFTDDKDLLAHAFQRSSERRAALEFIQSQNQNSSKTIHEEAPKPTIRTTPEPLPATRLAAPAPGQHPHDRTQYYAGSGVDPLQCAQYLHSVCPDPEPRVQVELPLFPLPGDGRRLPGPEEVYHPAHQELSPGLGR